MTGTDRRRTNLWIYNLRPPLVQCPAGRVFQYRVGSGRSVEKYDRGFPGIFFTFGYFWVFRLFLGMSGISGYVGYFWVYPYILGLFSNIQ